MSARLAVISLPISQTAVLERFEAVERLSELFVIHAYVLSEDSIDFLEVLGKPALITVSPDGEAERVFSGLIFEAELIDETRSELRYRLTMRPWLYALSRNRDIIIFQEKSTKDILQEVFTKRHCSDVDFTKLTRDYQPREYCVQYRESDFNFVSRLMEEEGIYYFFEQRDGGHVMVLCDDRTSHQQGAYESLSIVPSEQVVAEDRLWRWTESVVSGSEAKATYRNFDFERPSLTLEGTNEAAAAPASAASTPYYFRMNRPDAPTGSAMSAEKVEIYDFPQEFLANDVGNTLAETTMLAAFRHQRSYRGAGDAVLLTCGATLAVREHPVARLDQTYLIAGLTYRIEAENYVSGGEAVDGVEPVVVEILATPIDQPWRAPQITPKPLAAGPETAIVTGQPGDTVYTDKYGRVKVRFHWDRAPASPDNTCWIRVASASADNGFGHVALPRVGQEVVVDFLNGDPDRPLVIGGVYNGEKKQPYPLPDDKSRSVWRSHTFDGGANDYNEISFEDKNGSEIFNVQAQKDRTTLVKHDDTTTVTNNLSTTVQQGNITTDVQKGNFSLTVDLGTVTIEALQSITFKVGKSKVTMTQTGIAVEGIMLSHEGSVQFSAKAPMVQISGEATTQVKGGVVMIN